ncbi:putative periplasmic lipoprotein [Bacillus testis]|uniref:hypothetical protein n=1 Tax=Bacillus testis TaxID=1622072 RepID=UPI00067E6B8F|nr:hypothetical protein [Bacillus testis]
MKKFMAIGLAAGLLLTGCSQQTAEKDPKAQSATPVTENAPLEEKTVAPKVSTKQTAGTQQADDFTDAVAELVKKADSTAPKGTQEERRNTFFTLHNEIEQLEDQMDAYEDKLEANYNAGTVTIEQYQAEEQKLDVLADQLDQAEDALELTFNLKD